jgi:hypothetical protein
MFWCLCGTAMVITAVRKVQKTTVHSLALVFLAFWFKDTRIFKKATEKKCCTKDREKSEQKLMMGVRTWCENTQSQDCWSRYGACQRGQKHVNVQALTKK